MVKVKIIHKGLILVGVPLVFGTAFIWLLMSGLTDANRLINRELLVKDVTISFITANCAAIGAHRCARCYRFNHDSFFRKYYECNREQSLSETRHLKAQLEKNESWLHVNPMQVASPKIGQTDVDQSFSPFLRKLQHISERQSRDTIKAMNWLQIRLIGGMLLGTVITIALAVFFCLNITNRLLIILTNTINLSKGTVLNPPLKGNDEIAELDQFIFKSATEIRELERFKKEMVGVVSHELKSPLSSVAGFLTSLSSGLFGDLNPRARDKVEKTHNSVKRLMGLVKDLLYLDRLELEMNPEEIAVAEVITSSVDTVKELAEQSGIEITVKNNAGTIFADRNRLIQVVVNLLSNALKFSPTQGKVVIETRQSEGWFECRVSDQGRGIPEEFAKQIFEPFKQVDSKDATTKKGTGLGLTISRSIVEQHGGVIGVDSVLGQGSTFWFKIPATAIANKKFVPDSSRQFMPPAQPEAKQVSQTNTQRTRKFSVLQQGLVIIAIPLIFQLAFGVVIGYMLHQVREQTKREQNSREILNCLNQGVEALVGSTQDIVMYALTNNESSKTGWDKFKSIELSMIDRANKLVAGDQEQVKAIRKARHVLEKYCSRLESQSAQNAGNIGLKQMLAKTGFTGMLNIFLSGTKDPVDTSMSAITMSDTGGMGKLEVLNEMRSNFKRLLEISKPGMEIKRLLESVMSREKAIGEKFSLERSKMIKTLELTLYAGIIINIALSIFLAFTLMRSLTSRLQHVMENTARLVKRTTLDPPKTGGDEIAYLDRVLYETGMRLGELEAFKRELISIVSHELRTPLLSISSALELFGTGVLGNLSEKGKNRLKFAKEEADRLIRLINDLLDIEKMEAGKFVLDKSEFSVDNLLNTSIAAVSSLAEMKGIKLDANVTDVLTHNETLYADRDRLCQVLINLLSNAIKFSPESGVININAQKDSTTMEFRVIDQGRGIPEELKQKIFNRFVQVEAADETIRGGTGLGLAISKAIVEQHGGTIGVESAPEHGSTFWFRLPQKGTLEDVRDKKPGTHFMQPDL